jgi:hypothetical protein
MASGQPCPLTVSVSSKQQSNSIRRFCKEYNIELHGKLSAFFNTFEETTNNNTLELYEPGNSTHDLTVVTEEKTNEVIRDVSPISTTNTHQVIRQNVHKRKVDQSIDPENSGTENTLR